MSGFKVNVNFGSDTFVAKPNFDIRGKANLKNIEFFENGIYKPEDYGADGFGEVNVDVQPTLEELTITDNGTYTPQEGVDGFSKVTAKFDTSSLPKVKVTTFKVSNDCIDENGYWAGELIDVSKLKDANQAFFNCSQLQQIDVSDWDISNLSDINGFFYHCSSLQQLDVSKWDTSSVINMTRLFAYCTQLQQLDVSKWDTSSVINMAEIFIGCAQLQQLDVSKWDTSSATNMTEIFTSCAQLQQLDVSKWDTSSVINMAEIFAGCAQLQQLDVSKWDTSSVINMAEIFTGCAQLQQLDVSKWDTSSVINMTRLFAHCTQLQQLDVSDWDTNNVVNMSWLFGYLNVGTLDLRKWDANNVSNIDFMFGGCNVQSLIGGITIEDVISEGISCLNGLKVGSATMLRLANNIDTASILALINGLADLTGQTAQTLTLGSTLGARLDTEQIAGVPAKEYLAGIANNKNWTIAY